MDTMHLGATLLANDAGAALGGWTPAHSLRLAILIGVFIVAVVALGLVLLIMRRRMFLPDNEMTAARSLMDELRAMRDRGDMSIEEYEAARKSLASKMASKLKTEAAEAPPASFGVKLPRSAMPPLPPRERTARPGFDLTGAPLPQPSPSPPSNAPPPHAPPLPPYPKPPPASPPPPPSTGPLGGPA